jgi:hypothetical protein
MQFLREFVHIVIGLTITLGALGLCLAFGIFAFIGMPLLAVGLGVLGSAIDRVSSPALRRSSRERA